MDVTCSTIFNECSVLVVVNVFNYFIKHLCIGLHPISNNNVKAGITTHFI